MVKIVASKSSKLANNTRLLSINGQKIEDFLEYRFYNDISATRKFLVQENGTKRVIVLKPYENLNLEFEPPQYRSCENDCAFCFIKGLPKGLRREIYFRDDDYRLSFLYGNFLSLTNISSDDIKRIGRLRLSPLYVSVHTTDSHLRKKIFKHERAGLILKQLAALIDEGIKIHCQIVVIPNLTDGKSLIKTIEDLIKLYPGVASVGIVPVGSTRYLKGIPLITKSRAGQIVNLVNNYHQRYQRNYKKGIIYLADEFFIKAGLAIPEREYYDDLPQYENGIGIVREFLDELKSLDKIKRMKGKYLLVTGRLAAPFLKRLKEKFSDLINVDVSSIENSLFGRKVSVSGLLGGVDFLRTIANLKESYDRIFLPPKCVNDSGEFLDNITLDDKRIIIAPNNLKELVKWLQ